MIAYIQQLIKMRSEIDPAQLDRYEDSFRNADKFVVFEGEFVPFSLIKSYKKGKKLLKSYTKNHGKAQIITKYDKELSHFYRKHGLKRDFDHIVDSISYLEIYSNDNPQNVTTNDLIIHADSVDGNEVLENDSTYLFDKQAVSSLSAYQNKPYNAQDELLKSIGRDFSEELVAPVNRWLEALDISDFAPTIERYWQVAGRFKRVIWGKLYHKNYSDKQVFFCVGIDLSTLSVFYGLDCLRTGTSKLSAEQIFKFDHYTNGIEIMKEQHLGTLSKIDLFKDSSDFINKLNPLYHDIVNYIWENKIDLSKLIGKLLPISTKVAGLPKTPIIQKKKTQSSAIKMVIDYERKLLEYKGKKELANKVQLCEVSAYDILSVEAGGKEKCIKVIASKSEGICGAAISQETINASISHSDRFYLYVVAHTNLVTSSGVLHIYKGRIDKVLEMTPKTLVVEA